MKTNVRRRRVKFQIAADPNSKVAVAGTFNGWDPEKGIMKSRGGVFSRHVLLEPGHYQYKFVVNGVWTVDPEQQEWTPNEHGSLNSVINIE